jgi:outer membrane protein assembly factor BamB
MFHSSRMRRALLAALAFSPLIMVTLLCPLQGGTADWPTFRGADRMAVSKETGLLQTWPEGGPQCVWEARGAGRSYSSLAIAAGKIFTLGDGLSGVEDKDEYLICFSQEHGQLLWKLRTGPPWNNWQASWQSSRSTPSTDGQLVYVVTPHGVLVCAEAATGIERWRKDLAKEFEGKKGDKWGYSESVLIDGDTVVCTPGGDKNTVVAFNKQNGEVKWKVARERDRGAGHTSIAISEIAGTRVYVQVTASGPIGIRAADGKLLWSYPLEETTAVIPTPIVRDDLVFFAAGYKRGGALLKQIPEQDGNVKIQEVYPVTKELANKHGGIVLVGDYLFGDSDDQGIPFCAELMTGTIKWKKRSVAGNGSAAFAAADGCLYIRFANGVVVLAKAIPDDYVEVGSFKVPDSGERPSWSHPVIADGKLYLREQDRILCYDIKAK